MTATEIRAIAEKHAEAYWDDECSSIIKCLTAAITEAIALDRQADDRMDDKELYWTKEFVDGMKAAHLLEIERLENRIRDLRGKLAEEEADVRECDKIIDELLGQIAALNDKLVNAEFAAAGWKKAAEDLKIKFDNLNNVPPALQ